MEHAVQTHGATSRTTSLLLSQWLLPTVMRIEFDRHGVRPREGLMHGATMRHLDEWLALFDRDTMRHVNRQ